VSKEKLASLASFGLSPPPWKCCSRSGQLERIGPPRDEAEPGPAAEGRRGADVLARRSPSPAARPSADDDETQSGLGLLGWQVAARLRLLPRSAAFCRVEAEKGRYSLAPGRNRTLEVGGSTPLGSTHVPPLGPPAPSNLRLIFAGGVRKGQRACRYAYRALPSAPWCLCRPSAGRACRARLPGSARRRVGTVGVGRIAREGAS
jgi:hypothetical protein